MEPQRFQRREQQEQHKQLQQEAVACQVLADHMGAWGSTLPASSRTRQRRATAARAATP